MKRISVKGSGKNIIFTILSRSENEKMKYSFSISGRRKNVIFLMAGPLSGVLKGWPYQLAKKFYFSTAWKKIEKNEL